MRPSLTILDWVLAVATAAIAVGLSLFPFVLAPPLRSMLDDFGGPIPAITNLVISSWFGLAMGIPSLGGVIAALGPLRSATVRVRRLVLVGALAVALVGVAMCVAGWRAPISQMADALQP